MGNQKYHFVCLECRRSVKRRPELEYVLEGGTESLAALPVACAQCRAPMFCAGKYFAAPKRRDDAGWKKLAWMIENGWRGDGWRTENWPTSPAMNLNDARESLRAHRESLSAKSQREKQLRSFEIARRSARWNFRRSRVARRREQLELKAQQKYQNAALERANKTN